MINLNKLTPKQEKILRHLVLRGHAMTGRMLREELKMTYIGVDTFSSLNAKRYIRSTDQGWLATDAGRLRVSDVV